MIPNFLRSLNNSFILKVKYEITFSEIISFLHKKIISFIKGRWDLYTGQEATVRTRHEQQTSLKLEKVYIKAVYCHSAYLTYLQSTSYKMPGWMKHKLESRLPGERSITSNMQMTPPLWQKVKTN